MTFEIEVSHDEIKNAIERKVRTAIANETNSWRADEEIKKIIKAKWNETIEQIILEVLSDSDSIKARIEKQIEAKLKAQITKLIKEK